MRYAEVIGDPIVQSKSPLIHKYWLDQLGLAGDYLRTRVPKHDLAVFLDRRKRELDWLGCNVTIPHKEAAFALVDRTAGEAQVTGAVNCIVPEAGALVGHNTDVDGVAAALESAEVHGRKVVVIGAGGAARAAVAYLASRGVGTLAVLARTASRALLLQPLCASQTLHVMRLDEAEAAFCGATVIVNASPLGMAGGEPVPRPILDALVRHGAGMTIFDMVTTPSRTQFLTAGEAAGGRAIDGLTMLIGQARRAFELFFGATAPVDQALHGFLATLMRE